MQKQPKFTIVTPSYNQGKFLRESLESVLNQDYHNYEYFVVDGGSTDGSLDIIKEYSSRINWWVSEPDGGQSEAINKGFQKATGDLLAWVNSDDVLFPGCLRVVSEYYMSNNKPDLIHSNIVIINKHGIITKLLYIPRQTRFFIERGVWSVSAPASFFSNSLMKKVGYLGPKYHISMDLDMWMKMVKADGNICYIPKYLGAFRMHEESKTVIYSMHYKSYGKYIQESDRIWKEYIPKTTKYSRNIWRYIWRVYRLINFNYIIGIIDTKLLRGKHWKSII